MNKSNEHVLNSSVHVRGVFHVLGLYKTDVLFLFDFAVHYKCKHISMVFLIILR